MARRACNTTDRRRVAVKCVNERGESISFTVSKQDLDNVAKHLNGTARRSYFEVTKLGSKRHKRR